MEEIRLDYSTKNIPLASRNEYTKLLLEKVESVIRRMRWKAFYMEKDDVDLSEEKFGFKSKRVPPKIEGMANFEREMFDMIHKLEFRDVNDDFQNKLKSDMKQINKSDKIYVPADKTRSIYKMDKEKYTKLLSDNVTAKYKRANEEIVKEIDAEFWEISKSLNIADRIEKTEEKNAFVTLKDHKSDFPARISCRLINPNKSELGKVSKRMIDRINNEIRSKLQVNQWRNTAAVLEWFDALENKKEISFMIFDIVDYYPSISESLLKKTLEWAKNYTNITKEEERCILHARKTLLFDHEKRTWMKRTTANAFDVAMGAYDGAEVCELVGLLILDKLQKIRGDASIGLYRDDGLAAIKTRSGREMNKLRQQFTKVFNDLDLKITIDTNLRSVNFLDTRLDLDTGKHKVYMKPANNPVYVHKNSNHPPAVIKQIPRSVNTRIAMLSSSSVEFKEAAPIYEKALKESGYDTKLEFTKESKKKEKRKRNRNRKVIWFNPPYNRNVRTNIGKTFLRLVDKCFDKKHKFHKIFNRNTVKVSYSCMKNVERIIKSHNSKLLMADKELDQNTKCNCRGNKVCPLNGQCLAKAVVYKTTVTAENKPEKIYIGISGGAFKERFNNHTASFKHESKAQSTELSKYIWNLKNSGCGFDIEWEIIKQSNTQMRTSGTCNLCVEEKLAILSAKKERGADNLNKRSELINKCRHTVKPPREPP